MVWKLRWFSQSLRLASDVAEELDIGLAYDVFEEYRQRVFVEAQLYNLSRPRKHVVDRSLFTARYY